MNKKHVVHPIKPIWDRNSKILILGSFPSVKSREVNFFYGHPQNRFWRVLANIFNDDIPLTIDDKKQFLLRYNIALWDVIKSCDIKGSSDSSIENVIPNDISKILNNSQIKQIYVNGKMAEKLYLKYIYQIIKLKPILLPSTSPANASYRLDMLIEEWKKLLICFLD